MIKFKKAKVRTEGQDADGMPVKVGEYDTSGFLVGYIDEGGLSWESREERDLAVGAGRIFDEFFGAKGLSMPTASIDEILANAGVLEEHRYAACKEYIEGQMLRALIVQGVREGYPDGT